MITTWPVGPIPVAPSAGVTASTVGTAVSAVAAVVNVVTTYAVSGFPARSCTAFCVHTWIMALPGYGVVGVKVATAPLTFHVPARL